ncbi:MAG: hypothetical protein IK095_07135 [Oscillospiraceae bacterium]|nr:hypothetical protein [Oscillospiraceae bacterium]
MEDRGGRYIQGPDGKMQGSLPEGGGAAGGEKAIRAQNKAQLEKGIRSLKKRMTEHMRYIEDPKGHVPDWDSLSQERKDKYLKHWAEEIKAFQSSIKAREAAVIEREGEMK